MARCRPYAPRRPLARPAVPLVLLSLLATLLPLAPAGALDASDRADDNRVEAAAIDLPAEGPICTAGEPGFVRNPATDAWQEFEGHPAALCEYDDAALPPLFPPYNMKVQVLYAPSAETAVTWSELTDDPDTDWRERRGNPVNFAVTDLSFNSDLFGGQVWCPGGDDVPLSDCEWSELGVALINECTIAVFSTVVEGVDAPANAIGGTKPDFDWDAMIRVLTEVSEANQALIAEEHLDGCVRKCRATGDLVHIDGVGVGHAKVEVTHNSQVLGNGAADAGGRFDVEFRCGKSPTFDPAIDEPHVEVVLSDGRGRYDIYGGPTGIVIARFRSDGMTIKPDVDRYRRDFRFSSIPGDYEALAGNVVKAQWDDWVEIYQNTAEAWALADQLGEVLDWALPLAVVANCQVPTSCQNRGNSFAFMQGSADAFIALGPSTSLMTDSGRPDNREYHEFGHFFHGDMWGNAIPRGGAGSTNHGGLNNGDSVEGVIEAFASWYALMVEKHVMGSPDSHIYNRRGFGWDIETDWRVFDSIPGKNGADNGEERAIAGLLLDLEDGPADYATNPARPAVDVTQVVSLPTASTRIQLYEASLTNTGGATTDPLVAVMILLHNGQEVYRVPSAVSPSRLSPGTSTTVGFSVPTVPQFPAWDNFRVEVTENHPVRPNRDDDPVDLTLAEVWTTMRDYRSVGNRATTVADLYAAFAAKLGAVDADGNRRPDVDDLFIAHGLYTNADGNQRYDAGTDIIGRTDTPTSGVRPAPDLESPGGRLEVSGLAPGTEVDLVILPSAPADHLARAVRLEVRPDHTVPLAGPPPGIGGHTVVMVRLPDGTRLVLADYTAGELSEQIRSGVADTVDLVEVLPPGANPNPDPPAPSATGYRMLEGDGTVHAFGQASQLGDAAGRLAAGERAVAMAVTPSGEGYSILTDQRRVFRFGDAPSLGGSQTISLRPGERLTTLAFTPSGNGVWIFSSQGRVLAFGDAGHFGDLLQFNLNGDIIGSVATPSGQGYYLVGSDGGVFTFGDAGYHGSIQEVVDRVVHRGFPASQWLSCPIVGLVPSPRGDGYWLVACDGGVFSFGRAAYHGSVPEVLGPGGRLNQEVNGMVAYGGGYLMVASDGGAFNFGAPFFGSLGANPPDDPILAITPYATR